ncbi:630_t:CDS:2, partial [Dentiscutata erythropus]
NSEKVKSVRIEEETMSSSNSNAEPTPKGGQINFKPSFSRLSLEVLKFLCHELGISDVGSKQDLISRLASEYKKKDDSVNELLGKEKSTYAGKDFGDAGQFANSQSENMHSFFTNSFSGQQPVAPSPMQVYPYFQPTLQQLPGQQGLFLSLPNFGVNGIGPSSAGQLNLGSGRRNDLNREVVCYLCDGKGHYANEYGSKKHFNRLFRGDNSRQRRT